MKYTVLVYKGAADEGGFWAKVAELPGCATQGETIDAIRETVTDAIEEYLHARSLAGKHSPASPVEAFEIDVAHEVSMQG